MKNLVKISTGRGSTSTDIGPNKYLYNIKENTRNKPYILYDDSCYGSARITLSKDTLDYDSEYKFYRHRDLTIKVRGTGTVKFHVPSGLAIDTIYFTYNNNIRTISTFSYDHNSVDDFQSRTMSTGETVSIRVTWKNQAYSQWYQRSLVLKVHIPELDTDVEAFSFISCTCPYEVYGNVESLYSYSGQYALTKIYKGLFYNYTDVNLSYDVEGQEDFSGSIGVPEYSGDYFTGYYETNDTLIDAFNLFLPNPTRTFQYEMMFYNCRNLKRGPKEINDDSTANYTLKQMFYGCSSLIYAPVTQIKYINNNCHGKIFSMFSHCTSLNYANMFFDNAFSSTSVRTLTFNNCSLYLTYSYPNYSNNIKVVLGGSYKNTHQIDKYDITPIMFCDNGYNDNSYMSDVQDANHPYEYDGKYWEFDIWTQIDDILNADGFFENPQGANKYIYVGRCWYNLRMYHAWESVSDYDISIALTEMCDFTGLSIYDNKNNRYCPFVYRFGADGELFYKETSSEWKDSIWCWNGKLPYNMRVGTMKLWFSRTLTNIDLEDYENTCECFELIDSDSSNAEDVFRKIDYKTNEKLNAYIYFDRQYYWEKYTEYKTYIDDGTAESFDLQILDDDGEIIYNGNLYLIATNKVFQEFADVEINDFID